MFNRDSNSIGGMGASARPGDIRRALRIVQRGLGQLIDDAEAYKDTLHEAYWAMTNDERITPEGTRIGEGLERALALGGLLGSARLLCPDLKPNGINDDYSTL